MKDLTFSGFSKSTFRAKNFRRFSIGINVESFLPSLFSFKTTGNTNATGRTVVQGGIEPQVRWRCHHKFPFFLLAPAFICLTEEREKTLVIVLLKHWKAWFLRCSLFLERLRPSLCWIGLQAMLWWRFGKQCCRSLYCLRQLCTAQAWEPSGFRPIGQRERTKNLQSVSHLFCYHLERHLRRKTHHCLSEHGATGCTCFLMLLIAARLNSATPKSPLYFAMKCSQ